jgi:formylglycine-generating enzyme required for sulfatase activity
MIMKNKNHLLVLVFVLMSVSLFGQKNFKAPDNFVFIPQGKAFVVDSIVNVDAFYIFKYEISNINYIEYLMYLKNNSSEETYLNALLDTNNFLLDDMYMEPYAKFYHKHPAYTNYPVLNIRHALAESYCEWLGMILSEKYPDYELTVRLPSKEEWIRAAKR